MSSIDLNDITVVCVTYNSSRILPALARTLEGMAAVVIVDNASSDDTVARARELIPQARVIARNENAGFGVANNEGAALADTPFLLLLNPDCEISHADIGKLRSCLQAHPDAGLVGPQGWRSASQLQKSWRPAFYQPQPKGPYQVPAQVTAAGWIHGSCYLIRREAFARIGGFDPVFFLFYEDDDLCLRLQHAGYSCLLEPAARTLHLGGKSSRPSKRTTFIKRFHYARSRQIALRRYAGEATARKHRWRLAAAWIPATLVYALMLRSKGVIKWSAWGLAGFCATVGSDALSRRIR